MCACVKRKKLHQPNGLHLSINHTNYNHDHAWYHVNPYTKGLRRFVVPLSIQSTTRMGCLSTQIYQDICQPWLTHHTETEMSITKEASQESDNNSKALEIPSYAAYLRTTTKGHQVPTSKANYLDMYEATCKSSNPASALSQMCI